MKTEQITIYRMLKSRFRDYATIPTHSEVDTMANNIAKLLFNSNLTEKDINEIVEHYEINIGVKAFDPETLVAKNINSKWFEEKKNNPDTKHEFWGRYEDYLRESKDFSESTIAVLKRSTEEILGYCANPTSNIGDIKKRKGLVVGDVQSGKTANYLALINMACDYGYRLIVVLAGLTDYLRKQTQTRVDDGFIGAISETIGSANAIYIGVGKLKKERYAVTLTNNNIDFKKENLSALNSTTADYNKPVILVVKKNKSTLENVKTWLKPGDINVTNHVLIIDDEADNASINTKNPENDPSVINALIRDLYNNFEIASYVGYTATPFANIFINPDDNESYRDLFPTDFITLLKTPDSYFGAEKVFGENVDGKTRFIREIDENEVNFLPVNHKKEYSYENLSESLKEAILVFLINNVIRTKRNQRNEHRSMMINISRFNKLQSEIKLRVSEYVENLRNIISQTSYMSKEKFLRNKEMYKMYDVYMNSDYYNDLREEVTWDEIQAGLSYEVERVKVLVANRNKNEEKINYEEYKDVGARFIVVGGFILSRGLTLEGLMVSYYSRNGSAYDVLMQMSRWFGYRPKYEDLCRIYMSNISIESFGATIDATNDLKQQFYEMKKQSKTPNDFGLMVKKSPETLNTLLVTSRNKSKNSVDKVITLNYSCTIVDTSKIYWNKNKNYKNIQIIRNEIENKLGHIQKFGNRYMYRNVDKDIIISVLEKIEIPPENKKFDCESICNYLRNSYNLKKWDIVVATGHESNKEKFSFGGELFNCVNRWFDYRAYDNEEFIRIAGNNNRLIDPGIFDSGLSEINKKEIQNNLESKTPKARDYLEKRTIPLFIIYPIDLKIRDNDKKKEKIKQQLEGDVLLGFGIGFPYNGEGISISYKLNKRKIQELEKEREYSEDDSDE